MTEMQSLLGKLRYKAFWTNYKILKKICDKCYPKRYPL